MKSLSTKREMTLTPSPHIVGMTLCLLILIVILFPSNIAAQDKISQVLVAFLYNFIKLTQWNPEPASYTIGVFNKDARGIKALATKQAKDKAIAVNEISDVSGLKDCHIVFVPKDQFGKIAEIKDALTGKGSLIVGDLVEEGKSNEFLKGGGMVCFLIKNKKIRFGINLKVATSAKLKINAKLVKVANNVIK